MVALGLSLTLLTAVHRFCLDIHQHFLSLSQAMNHRHDLQQAHRVLDQSISHSGFLGCFNPYTQGELRHTFHDEHPVAQLINNHNFLSVSYDEDSPVLTVMYARPRSAMKVTRLNSTLNQLNVSGFMKLKSNQLAVISDCHRATIFLTGTVNHEQNYIAIAPSNNGKSPQFLRGLNNVTTSLDNYFSPKQEPTFVYDLIYERFELNFGINGQGLYLNGHELIEKINKWQINIDNADCHDRTHISSLELQLEQAPGFIMSLGKLKPMLPCSNNST